MVFCNKSVIVLQAFFNTCHNPYFNRWFSAIKLQTYYKVVQQEVTILILIDGFLQF